MYVMRPVRNGLITNMYFCLRMNDYSCDNIENADQAVVGAGMPLPMIYLNFFSFLLYYRYKYFSWDAHREASCYPSDKISYRFMVIKCG